jgi:F-type H+-transporting ATPase subunit alpha
MPTKQAERKAMADTESNLHTAVVDSINNVEDVLKDFRPNLRASQIGIVEYVGEGIARAGGLPDVKADELIRMANGIAGLAFDLRPRQVGIILLDKPEQLSVGSRVTSTGRVLDVPVGEALLGRTVDAIGRPRDRKGSLDGLERRPIEREAPEMMDRAPVEKPLQTGLKVVDALIPIGRGQRELILGDRQTGKSAIALDTIINQRGKDVICFYCAIGRKNSAVAKFITDLERHGAHEYTSVVVVGGDDPPGLLFIAPYAATAMAEYFMDQGRDVLVVYDDLTQHARAYRELSLLLRRPPGREAYPGDIFYIHSRLLERATHFNDDRGGGSLTALPIVETQAQNLSAYIPTNLISITDGQVYLSPRLFRKGFLPAVDVGKSVSRVGGKTQLPAYRDVAGDLKLSYSQFEELESFSRFSTRLDEDTRKTLERGRRVRESLRQPQFQPMSVMEQLAALLAVTNGLYDDIETSQLVEIEKRLRSVARERFDEIQSAILEGSELKSEYRQRIIEKLSESVKKADTEEGQNADS